MNINLLVILSLFMQCVNLQTLSLQNWDDYINTHLSEGVMNFAHGLTQVIDANENHGNIIFSPLNIAGLLGVLLLGSVGKPNETLSALVFSEDDVASGDSEFLHHMFANLMRSIESVHRNNFIKTPEIVLKNIIFVQDGYSIRPNFAAFVHDVYKYDLANVDFSSDPSMTKNTINEWINSATQGKISDFLTDPLDSLTRMFLASALYFNGKWKYSFNDELTRREPFYLESGGSVEVDMMITKNKFLYSSGSENKRYPGLGADIVGLPYQINDNKLKSKITMFLLLPHSKNLSDFISHLDVNLLNRQIRFMDYVDCTVKLPKMKLSSTLNLDDTLQSFGFNSMFDQNLANFGLLSTDEVSHKPLNSSRIQTDIEMRTKENDHLKFLNFQQYVKSKEFPFYGLDELRSSRNFTNPGLFVARVLHKVEVDITEKGTGAAAVIIAKISRRCFSGDINITFNRPFLFFIRHDPSGLISLWGAVRKPTPYY